MGTRKLLRAELETELATLGDWECPALWAEGVPSFALGARGLGPWFNRALPTGPKAEGLADRTGVCITCLIAGLVC